MFIKGSKNSPNEELTLTELHGNLSLLYQSFVASTYRSDRLSENDLKIR